MAFLQPFPMSTHAIHRAKLVSSTRQTPITATVKTRRRRRRASSQPTAVSQETTGRPSNLPDDLTSHSLLTAAQEHELLRDIHFLRDEEFTRKILTSENDAAPSDEAVATALSLAPQELVSRRRMALKARNKLVTANVRLVSVIAGQVYQKTGGSYTRTMVESPGVSRADLVQEGCIALIRAAELYDGRADTRFSTYASRAVWSACKRAATPTSCIVTLPDRLRRAAIKSRALEGRDVHEDDMEGSWTDRLQRSSREYLPSHLVQLANAHLTSGVLLDEPARRQHDGHAYTGHTTRADLLQCNQPLPEELVAEESLRTDVHAACYDVLSQREADILVLKFGLNGETPMLAKDIASLYGVTGARISQLVSTARHTLREKAKYLEHLLHDL